jgi:hypothetical protein
MQPFDPRPVEQEPQAIPRLRADEACADPLPSPGVVSAKDIAIKESDH